jgi:hypothetical protein
MRAIKIGQKGFWFHVHTHSPHCTKVGIPYSKSADTPELTGVLRSLLDDGITYPCISWDLKFPGGQESSRVYHISFD